MTIDSPKTAREFIHAWRGHPAARRHYQIQAESQRTCAILSGPNIVQAERHLKAAVILTDESDRANHDLYSL